MKIDQKTKNQIWKYFHQAWGQAQGSSEYDKAVWLKLDNLLAKLINK